MSPACNSEKYKFTKFVILASKSVSKGCEPHLSCTNANEAGFVLRPFNADTPASRKDRAIHFLGGVSNQLPHSHNYSF
jgi:hypothetical protein